MSTTGLVEVLSNVTWLLTAISDCRACRLVQLKAEGVPQIGEAVALPDDGNALRRDGGGGIGCLGSIRHIRGRQRETADGVQRDRKCARARDERGVGAGSVAVPSVEVMPTVSFTVLTRFQ